MNKKLALLLILCIIGTFVLSSGCTTPQTGTIQVTSVPSGAMVTLHRLDTAAVLQHGTTPHLFFNIPIGSYSVFISMTGYQPFSTNINTSTGKTVYINAVLAPITTPTAIQTTQSTIVPTTPLSSNPNIISGTDACFQQCDFPEYCENIRSSMCGFGGQWWNTGERNVFYCSEGGFSLDAMKFYFISPNKVTYKDIKLNYTTWTD
jgi:hypothetical protein